MDTSSLAMKIVIIHLSDIHLTSDNKNNIIIQRKQNIVETSLEPIFNINADIIFLVVSGDIAFSGRTEEYEIATDFLGYIKKELEEKAQKKVIPIFIPGNHDCNFTFHDQTRTLLLENIWKSDNVNELTLEEKTLDNCLTVQKEFDSFIENIQMEKVTNYGELYNDKLLSITEFKYGKFNIIFKCFNSSWDSLKKEAPGRKIFPIKNYELNLPNYVADLVIGIMHHPYNWFNHINSQRLKEIIENKVDLLLTGHEHIPGISTKTDIDKNVTDFVEGAVLQDTDNKNKSGFNILIFDLEKTEKKQYQYDWNGKNYSIYKSSEWEAYKRNKNLQKKEVKISPEFRNFLNDPGVQINHPYKRNVDLDDIFVFPDVSPLNIDVFNKDEKENDPISSKRLLEFEKFKNKISILGDEGSGKTTLCKIMIQKFLEIDLVPIYIDGQDIKSPTLDKFISILDDKYKWQYNPENFVKIKSIPQNKHILIIDNFDKTKLNPTSLVKLINGIAEKFPNIIITRENFYNIEEMLSESELDTTIINQFSEFGLLEFGHLLRMKLIEKWTSLGREHSIDPSVLISQCEKIIHAIDTIVGKNFIPTYPIFLISILHILEAKEQQDVGESAYGYYYQYLITSSLSKNVARKDLGKYLDYLSELAYCMFKTDSLYISYEALEEFHDYFCKEYAKSYLNFSDTIEKLIKSNTLCRENSDFKFRYKYIYYYSVAKYLSKNFSNSNELKELIITMCNKLHVEEYANIVMFLIHHSDDPFVLNKIYEVAANLFKKFEPLNMDNDITSINTLIRDLPKKALEEKNVAKFRDDYYREKDKIETRFQNKTNENIKDNNDEQTEIGAEINSAFKTIEIIGQILKNHSLRAHELEILTSEVYLIGFRFLKAFVTMIGVNEEILTKKAESYLEGKEQIDRVTLVSKLKQFFYMFYKFVFFGIIKKLSLSLGHEDLKDTFKAIESEYNTTCVKLVNLSIKLDHYDQVHITGMPISDIRQLAKMLENNKLGFDLLRELVFRHIYMFNTKYQDKQKIADIFKIPVKTQRTIYEKSTQKKLK